MDELKHELMYEENHTCTVHGTERRKCMEHARNCGYV